MANITNAQKAPILVDGAHLQQGTNIASSDDAVASIANGTLGVYVVGNAVGSVILSLTVAGRAGALSLDVLEAPLDVALGAPEPK